MKTLIILSSFILFASASFYDALDQQSSELVSEFLVGMDQAPPLATLLEPEFAEEADIIEEEVKIQLAGSLRQVLARVLQHVRESLESAEELAKGFMVKAAQLVEKLKSLSGVGEELLERIRERIGEWVRAFLRKVSPSGEEYSLVRVPLELDDKNLMENVKQNILERLNLEDIEEFIRGKLSKLGEFSSALLEALGQGDAVHKLRDLLEALLPGFRQDYSLKDIFKKVKDFFKKVGLKIADKFSSFGNWVKNVAVKGWEKIKDQAGKLKELAKVVTAQAKTMSKDALQQALQYFESHKAEIGQLAWAAVKAALMTALKAKG